MTTIADFDPEPDTRLLRDLLALLLVSAGVHAISLSSLQWSPEHVLTPSDPPTELSLELSATAALSEDKLIDVLEQLDQVIEFSAQRKPLPEKREVIASSSSSEQAHENNNSVYDLPLQELPTLACNAQQKRTAGHRCADEKEGIGHLYAGAYEHYLAGLFGEQRSVSAERASDLKVIDSLLAQQSIVNDALSNFDKPPAHLLSEKNRIGSELARIDKKYSSVDLLKILGSTYNTAKKIARARRKDQ
ncbi:MAG: hypothetical protein AAF542_05215 [Pseudomonadota bacterium]